jgi:hypothetical protein
VDRVWRGLESERSHRYQSLSSRREGHLRLLKHLPAPERVGHSPEMVVLGGQIRPGEEGSHLAEEEEGPIHLAAEEVVPVAIEEAHLEADPILPAVVEDLHAADPILLVEAADLLGEDPNRPAVEGEGDPNCPVAEGIADRNHLRTAAEEDHRMTCLAL